MSTEPTINAPDVVRALEAFRDKWNDAGAEHGSLEQTLHELGFGDYLELRLACKQEAYGWAAQCPLNATIDDVVSLIAASMTTALGAGVMLGRFTSGEVPE